ncbi:hypothetical protein CTI14_10030 [Methylobacterium radiotolerans]|nr:hypothetical protein CTI14_10030 [Methylobacterium radiotolerans]
MLVHALPAPPNGSDDRATAKIGDAMRDVRATESRCTTDRSMRRDADPVGKSDSVPRRSVALWCG